MRSSRTALIAAGFFVGCLVGAVSPIRGFEATRAGAVNGERSAAVGSVNPIVAISRDQRISAHIANLPLNEVLRLMSERSLFDIKDTLPSDETVSINFSDLTLDKALKKLMRGYNYVLLDRGTAMKPLLMVMGRVVRPNPAERNVPRRVVAAVPANQPPDPRTYYVPPTLTDQPRPATRPGTRVGRSAARAGSVPEPPAPRPAAGTVADAVPSRPANPPSQEVRGATGPVQQQPAQPAPASTPENIGVRF
jgi:hypothetical protein